MVAMRSMCGGYVCVVGCVQVCTWYVRNVCGVRDACDITWCVMRCVYTGVCGMDVYDQGGLWVVCVWSGVYVVCVVCAAVYVCVFVHDVRVDVVIYVLCMCVWCLCVIVVHVTGMSSVGAQCIYG